MKLQKKVSQFFVSLMKNLVNFKLNLGPFWIRVLIVRKMRFIIASKGNPKNKVL